MKLNPINPETKLIKLSQTDTEISEVLLVNKGSRLFFFPETT